MFYEYLKLSMWVLGRFNSTHPIPGDLPMTNLKSAVYIPKGQDDITFFVDQIKLTQEK